MFSRTTRPLTLGAGVALAAAGVLLATAVPAGAATTPSTVSLAATAYGSTAKVGAISSGRTALFSACSTAPGAPYGAKVAATDLGGALGKVGAAVTTGTRTGSSVVVTSTTGETSLLGGLVQAEAISATSTSSLSGSSVTASGSTVITGLKIAGLSQTVPAGTASTISIPGVATVTFNQQTSSTSYRTKQLTVDALRIDLLKDNPLGLPTGSIVVGSASSGASPRPTFFAPDGQAYGTTVKIGSLVTSDPTAYVGMPCGGTGGSVKTNRVAGLKLPGVATVGSVTSTGQSTDGAGRTSAVFGSTVSGVNLLDGAVTADAVTVKSTSSRSDAGLTTSDAGTVITGLKVLGEAVTVSTKANSTIDVAGIGTLTLHKTVKQTSGLDVIGLELRLSTQQLGLDAGSVVQVAVAKSRVAAR